MKAWFERSFEFGFPAELLPNLMARLRGTPARLEETLRGRPAEALTAKPERKWSAQEHAGHLLELEPLWLARVEDFTTGAAVLTRADLTNRSTDEGRYNDRPVGDVLAAFREARGRLVARCAELAGPAWERSITHPRLGTPMRLADHLYFAAEHDDHHLAQIWEMVEGRRF